MNYKEQENNNFKQSFITGPVLVNNILINPTLDELKEYGVGYLQNEPSYVGENNNVKYVNITCWAKSVTDPTIILNWNIRLNATNLTDKAGDKFCFINDKGNTSWATDISLLPDWFKTPGVRKALQGEEQFYSFMNAFNNNIFRKNDAIISVLESQDSLKSLFAGKFGELKAANTLRGNKIKVIVGLKEEDNKFYHWVYNKVFYHHWVNDVYLYESSEKKGNVSFEYLINYLINVDVNNKFNPVIWSKDEVIWNLEDVKAKYDEVVTKEPEPPVFTSNPAYNDLPF